MTIQEMISRYRLRDAGDGRLQIQNVTLCKKDDALEIIKENKQAILDFLREEKKNREAAAAREAEEKRIRDQKLYEKARAGDDVFILAVNFWDDLTCPTLVVAEILDPETMPGYSEWFRHNCVSIPVHHLKLDHLHSYNKDYNFLFDGRQRYHNPQGRDTIPVTPEEWDLLEKTETERAEAERQAEEEKNRRFAEKVAAKKARKQELMSKIDDWQTTSRTIRDEGGSTRSYRHTITAGGRTLVYTERNVFDFGRVINPEYEISSGIYGGLCDLVDGKQVWRTFRKGEGSVVVRELDDFEKVCMELIASFGPYANSGVRM